MEAVPRILVLLAGVAALVLLAWRLRVLTVSGTVAAWILGAIVVLLGGWSWVLPLLIAFASASAWSRAPRPGASAPPDDHADSADREAPDDHRRGRDARQVVANGGIAGFLVVGHAIVGGPCWFVAYLAAWAALAADTWATEIGTRWGGPPRALVGGHRVRPGESGGVSLLGLGASIAGAVVVALSALVIGGWTAWPLAAVAAAAGTVGALIDSLLGCLVQARWRCADCGAVVEARHHCPDAGAIRLRGWGWVDNHVVNALGIAAAAQVGAVGWCFGG